jgi:hypothetical protein
MKRLCYGSICRMWKNNKMQVTKKKPAVFIRIID